MGKQLTKGGLYMMKKFFLCLLALLSLCPAALAGIFDGASHLPGGIADYLAASDQWSQWQVTGWANPSGQEDHFVALHKDGRNDLLCFTQDGASYSFAWHNDDALPDNGHPFLLSDATGARDLYTQKRYNAPSLSSYYILEDELQDFHCLWSKHSGAWLLQTYSLFQPEAFTVHTEEDSFSFYFSDVQEDPAIVRGVFQRDLRHFTADALPMSLKQAQEKLSIPPDIPQGKLEARNIKFTGGKRYDVYRGPGAFFGIAGNGSAAVSTNDWIQVFGRDGEWILIQYAITNERMRIGWIIADALPDGVSVPELNFTAALATVTVDGAVVTDDPLLSQTAIALLPAGTRVAVLSSLGEWRYVQVNGEAASYGFIHSDALQPETLEERARRQGSNALTEVYGYSQADADTLFCFDYQVLGNELAITMYPAAHPNWMYEAVFRLDTGKHIRSATPFATDYAAYPGEGIFRYTIDTALSRGWLQRWQWEDRALLRQWLVEWEQPMTGALASGLEGGDLSPAQAVTELFLGSYGPQDSWPQALTEWHEIILKNVEENYQGNG